MTAECLALNGTPVLIPSRFREHWEREDGKKEQAGRQGGVLGDAVFWSQCGHCMHELAVIVVTYTHAQGDKLSQHSSRQHQPDSTVVKKDRIPKMGGAMLRGMEE